MFIPVSLGLLSGGSVFEKRMREVKNGAGVVAVRGEWVVGGGWVRGRGFG